jgi:transposase-like protein
MSKTAPTIQSFDTLFQMMAAFPDEQSAVDHFTAIRWKNGAFCPLCGSTRVYHFSDKRTHKCGDCRKRFSIKVGTIFEDSKIGLRKWMMAIWLITSHKKGVASTTLARDIGVTQKTAWFMLHRLRHAAQTRAFNRPLAGEVEADETFIGGKEKNKHAWQRTGGKQGGAGKIAVLGMLERGGELRTGVTPNLSARAVQTVIRDNVASGTALIPGIAGFGDLDFGSRPRALNPMCSSTGSMAGLHAARRSVFMAVRGRRRQHARKPSVCSCWFGKASIR